MKRSYRRRSDDERIAELQSKIDQLKGKLDQRERPDVPVLREIPKIQRRLNKFVQLAVDHGRQDLANSTMAFVAGLERVLIDTPLARRRTRDDDDDGGE